MTEAEWLACDEPGAMLESLRGKASDRKLRLFCCACCRRVADRLGRAHRKAVDIAERYADGDAGWWKSFWGEVLALPPELPATWEQADARPARYAAYLTVRSWGKRRDNQGPEQPHRPHDLFGNPYGIPAAMEAAHFTRAAGRPQSPEQAHLLRDLFGNPFRPVSLAPAWLSPTVKNLARAIYDGRLFDDLPVLADALEDAGCDDADTLSHCRGTGPHVRGCWVVDLILGKQ